MLQPAIQEFGIQAASFLAGIDEMIASTGELAGALDVTAASAERLSGVFAGASAADEQFARIEAALAEQTDALSRDLDMLRGRHAAGPAARRGDCR